MSRILALLSGIAVAALVTDGTRNDNMDDGRRFRRVLEDKGYPLTYFEVSQGHNWNNWGPLLPEVLATFYGRQ